MDVSKGWYVFYTLMCKPTTRLVSTRFNCVNKRVGPEFGPKPDNRKKTRAQIILNSKSDKKILWKAFYKKLFFGLCHVRFFLHFTLAAEGYI